MAEHSSLQPAYQLSSLWWLRSIQRCIWRCHRYSFLLSSFVCDSCCWWLKSILQSRLMGPRTLSTNMKFPGITKLTWRRFLWIASWRHISRTDQLANVWSVGEWRTINEQGWMKTGLDGSMGGMQPSHWWQRDFVHHNRILKAHNECSKQSK